MKDLKTLVQKLLTQKPDLCGLHAYDSGAFARYKNGKVLYSIDLFHSGEMNRLNLDISQNDPVFCDFDDGEPFAFLGHYECDLNEREFMEMKWKIDEWEKVLNKERFDAFAEYVESLPGDARDELLND